MKAPRFFLRGFKRPHEVASAALGKLERQVLEEIWRREETTVRDVSRRLRGKPALAYTTVMTTLDRLYKKGVLSRVQSGRAFVYSAAVTREQLQASIASSLLTGLLQGKADATLPVLSNLVDTVSAQDGGADLLKDLEALVREKRRRLECSKPL